MQNIADNSHAQLREVFFVMANCVHVEQALRRMRMPSVAGIDDVNVFFAQAVQMLGHQIRRARLIVAHNKHIGVHRREVIHRVEQRFALAG